MELHETYLDFLRDTTDIYKYGIVKVTSVKITSNVLHQNIMIFRIMVLDWDETQFADTLIRSVESFNNWKMQVSLELL